MNDAFIWRWSAPGPAEPPSLQVLFVEPPGIPGTALTAALRDYHPELAAATAEIVPVSELPPEANVVSPDGPPAAAVGLIAWGKHVLKLILFPAPMPASAVEGCLRPALLPPEMKSDARAHRGHALLYYAGAETDPLEQLVALGAVAGALARFHAIVTLNEEARAAIPSFALLPDEEGEDMLRSLRTLPIPYLYGGFVKMELTDVPGVWVRTFANHRLGLPNLAYHAAGHDEGQQVFGLFAGVLGYLRETGLTFEIGEIVRVGEGDNTHLRVRAPAEAEWWLESRGPMLVLDRVEVRDG
jgi:hypothetical protein